MFNCDKIKKNFVELGINLKFNQCLNVYVIYIDKPCIQILMMRGAYTLYSECTAAQVEHVSSHIG